MKEEKIDLLVDLFKKNMTVMKRSFKTFMTPPTENQKLSPHQNFCLGILHRDDSMSMGELAKKMGVSNQQLTRIVDGLTEVGLVDRFTSPENRRMVLVQIGDTGKNLMAQHDEQLKVRMSEYLVANLSEEDIDNCIYHMKSFTEILAKLTK